VTWQEYGEDLEVRLADLHARIHREPITPNRREESGYRNPMEGNDRGTAAPEDKIVQRAVGTVLNQIWEEHFQGFSYGFRPGRSQHDALDARYGWGLCGRK
jgi:hypothetical protein